MAYALISAYPHFFQKLNAKNLISLSVDQTSFRCFFSNGNYDDSFDGGSKARQRQTSTSFRNCLFPSTSFLIIFYSLIFPFLFTANWDHWTVLELLCATSIIKTIEGDSQASLQKAKKARSKTVAKTLTFFHTELNWSYSRMESTKKKLSLWIIHSSLLKRQNEF